MATIPPCGRGLRLLVAMALVAATAVYGARPANAVTSIPNLVLMSTSIPRGGSTDFTSTFEMDEGTAQATLNVGTKLAGTFTGCTATPVTPGPGTFTCTVVGGMVSVSDGVPPAVRVSVVLTGTITASRSFGFSSDESNATMSTEDVPDVSITLNQGVSITSSPQTVTVRENTASDAKVAITTTAPAAGSANAPRGTGVTLSADLTRGGALPQTTNALATLTPIGPGPHVGTLPPPQAVQWTGNQTSKNVSFTVNVPLDTPVGGTGTYQIVVTYDPYDGDGAQVPPLTNPDTEVGAPRTFTVTNNPSTDAIVSLVIDGPTNGGSVPRGTTVDYMVTLNRTGKTNQTTVVDLSLEAVGDARGTTVPLAIEVFFATNDLSESRPITVTVPPGADLGSVEYRFKGVYDPTTGPPTPANKVDTTFSDARSFTVVLAQPTLALVTTPAEGTVIDRSTPTVPSTMELKATITNPAGAAALTTGVLTIDIPAGMKVTPGSTAPDALVGPTVTPDDGVLPAGDAVGPAKVTVTYALIPAGASRTLTVPTTILGTATKKDGADILVKTDFVGAPGPLNPADPPPPPVTLSDDSQFELRADADLKMIVVRPTATDQLDPDEISVAVTYAIENLGPDRAAGVKFVVTPPDGFVGSVNPNENGSDWACTNTTAGPSPTDIICTYQPALLNAGVTTTAVGITWTFNTIGPKVFSATASSNTFDPVVANNTPLAADVTTTISKPTAGVTITAAATPDPVVVAADDPAEVSVTYAISNNGPKNIKAKITVAPPAGATLLTLTGVGTCAPVVPTAGATGSTTCSLGTLQKPTPAGSTPTPLLVVATYSVPQSVFLASGSPTPYRATLSASIAPVDGGTFGAGSVTSASDTVTGTKADLQMNVTAPTTARLNPSDEFPNGRVEVPVEYTVTNLGPQGAAAVTFTATAPAGQAAIAVNPVEANLPGGGNPGPAWVCGEIAAGSTTTTCTYQGNPLAGSGPNATTPKVTITWTLETAGVKTFAAAASTTTLDPDLTNNTPNPPVTGAVESPLGGVRITASASPDLAPVAADAIDGPALVTVTYTITNSGPGNVRAEITLVPPTGATLKIASGTGSCTPNVPAGGTTGSTTCSLGNIQKPSPPGSDPTPKTVTATYIVPKSVFLASAQYQASFSATIAPTNGGSFSTACVDPAIPTPGCSITAASDTVTGTAPAIDLGLAAVTNPPLVNRPNGTIPSVDSPVLEPRIITYENWSPAFVVRAGTAFIDLTIPPTPSIGVPAQCPLTTALPNVVRCPVTGEVAKATGAGPGTAILTLQIPLQTDLNVPLQVQAVVDDPTTEAAAGTTAPNRVATSGGAPDQRSFALDLNRRPSETTDIGPGVPAGGTLTAFPIPLHNDDDGDVMKVAMPTPSISCAAPVANCVVSGGSAENLSVTAAADRLTVSHTSSTAIDPAVPVTVEVSYVVDDEKGPGSSSTSTLLVKLLPAIAPRVPGSFGDPPATAPFSFGVSTAPRLGKSVSTIEVLGGELGKDAAGVIFPASPGPGVTSYDLTGVEQIGVTGSTAALKPGAVHKAVEYVPAPGYTTDPLQDGSAAPPLDAFTYTATGKKGDDVIFTLENRPRIEVENQNPIGVDGDLVVVPNTGASLQHPLVDDRDGNTVGAAIDTFAFNDKADLAILCIGPRPADATVPPTDTTCNDPAMKKAGVDLTVAAPNGTGSITAQLAKESNTDLGITANRTVIVTPDAKVRGDAPFAAVIADFRGGVGWSPVDVVVSNQDPELIAGVPAVPKNSPPTQVIDSKDAGRDANGDLVKISTFTQPEHGKVFVQDETILMYEPERDYVGPDSLILGVADSGNGSNQARLNIDVVEAAAQPVAAEVTDPGGGQPAGSLATTGGDPLALIVAGTASLLLGFILVHASRRRQTVPLLAGARHLRT